MFNFKDHAVFRNEIFSFELKQETKNYKCVTICPNVFEYNFDAIYVDGDFLIEFVGLYTKNEHSSGSKLYNEIYVHISRIAIKI